MILVDTSVWVDHLNAPDATMTARLRTNDVLMHSMVIGELACGNLRAREARIADLKGVQGIAELGNDVVITRIEEHNLMGDALRVWREAGRWERALHFAEGTEREDLEWLRELERAVEKRPADLDQRLTLGERERLDQVASKATRV